MNIQQLTPNRILISVMEDEMQPYGLGYDSFSMGSEPSRRMLLSILQAAETQTGLSLRGQHLVVEAMPFPKGCLILISLNRKQSRKKYRIIARSGTYSFRFDSGENLLRCLELTGNLSLSRPGWKVFRTAEGYWIIVRHAMPGKKYMYTLKEFSSYYRRGEIFAAAVQERSISSNSSGF